MIEAKLRARLAPSLAAPLAEPSQADRLRTAVRTVILKAMGEVTQILAAIERGDPVAAEQLFPLVYDELRTLAAQKLAQEKPGQTLQPTALVHEAYLRLVGGQQFEGRTHFFGAAAEAMRRILVDAARRKGRDKRGGDRRREQPDLDNLTVTGSDDDLLSLHDALEQF